MEVKKCPYCGENPSIRLIWRGNNNSLYYIECARYHFDFPHHVEATTKEEAIKLWNDYVSEIERTDELDEKDSDERH